MPEKPGKLLPALYGGIVIGVIAGIPMLNFLNCFCCAGVLLGGFLSVFFFSRDFGPGMPPMTNGDAVGLGALAGLFGALIDAAIALAVYFAFGNVAGEMMYDFIVGLYDSMGILDKIPPDALEQMEQMKYAGLQAWQLLIGFVVYPLFGLLGGLIGYAVFKPKTSRMQTPGGGAAGV
ncbi:MAG: hypothetical protein WB626_07040 [Bacteroidota bacterium]